MTNQAAIIDCPEQLNVGEHITIEGEFDVLEGIVCKPCDDLDGYIWIIEDDTGEKLRIRGNLGRVIEWQGLEIR